MDPLHDYDDFMRIDESIRDLLFDTNLSRSEIAKELDITQKELADRIKALGLGWVRRNNKKLSRGHAAITQQLKKLLPGDKIVNEFHVGERLMLDIYCPKYKIGIEYHGRQHFEYVEFFHSTYNGFLESQKRDERKEELCKEQGITLIVFRYNDIITEEVIFNRVLDALRSECDNTEAASKGKKKPKKDPNSFYEIQKQRRRQYEKESYQRLKKWRKNGKRD